MMLFGSSPNAIMSRALRTSNRATQVEDRMTCIGYACPNHRSGSMLAGKGSTPLGVFRVL